MITRSNWPLSWISYDRLLEICTQLIKEATPKHKGLKYNNIVDPFSALFDMTVSRISFDEWERAEIRRQDQKTLQNAIGKFHQMVLGSVEGWQDLEVGDVFDLRNDERKIIAEVKNKFNTVKASDKFHIYEDMATWRGAEKKNREYTGYFVQILVNTPKFDRPFTPTDHTKAGVKLSESPFIREIDGRSFYTLVTGSLTAFEDLYNVLPDVLSMATRGEWNAEQVKQHPLFKDLLTKTNIQ